ncbi:MAG: tetratricopeptide repeat protein [Planctomycetes bacterium]|nr:tetratricopeptide repeat protein [Planctomycetota bacterium]
MSELSNNPPPQVERESRTATWLRVVGTIVLFLLVFIGAIEVYGRTGKLDNSVGQFLGEVTRFLTYVATGLALGGLLVGIAALLRVLRDLHYSFIRVEKFQYEKSDAAPASSDADHGSRNSAAAKNDGDGDGLAGGHWREMVSILSDIRENSLLTEPERGQKKVRVANQEIQESAQRIQTLTQEGQFAQARDLADQIARRHPDDSRAKALPVEVEKSRERNESDDVRNTSKQVEDLVSISAWSRARDLAQQLQQRHPDSSEARQLLLRIEREHHTFDEEQKRRMSAEVQRFVTRRRWEEAHAVAVAFIERFPGCEESEALRMQLPTLETNAEIEKRQRLESQIMDHVRNGNYFDAVELARRVIDQYPDSPQAEVLRGQIERLEELAENPDAAPARVRID